MTWLIVILYSFADYLAYGAFQDARRGVSEIYRYVQALVLIALFVFLFIARPNDAYAAAIFWWTFGCDWLYYGFSYLPFKKIWSKLDGWEDSLSDIRNGLDHAWFTPVGLYYICFTEKAAPTKHLVFQGIVGLGLSVAVWCL